MFGNRCTCTNNFLSNYYALKINTGVLFPLFNIHLKYSLVILCIGIITDFMNKWKHSASSWLIFPSVSSPLQQVMYTFTDQYCGVIKQAHIKIHMYLYTNTGVLHRSTQFTVLGSKDNIHFFGGYIIKYSFLQHNWPIFVNFWSIRYT